MIIALRLSLLSFPLTDVPASGMYFLTYEVIKRKVVESAPKDKPASKARELGGTIFAGGMGKFLMNNNLRWFSR